MSGNPPEYRFRASASSITGELQRPSKITVPPLEKVELVENGHICKRLAKCNRDGLISFEEAYLEAGRSHDDIHDRQTSYALAVIEGLNVAEMLTADRVVSRMSVYSPVKDYFGEHTFDITGSYFENLKIAGYKIDLKLDTYKFHKLNSYSEFLRSYEEDKKSGKEKKIENSFLFNELCKLGEADLKELLSQYDALPKAPGTIEQWRTDTQKSAEGSYLCSAASHLNLDNCIGQKSELAGYGAVICIPKFGVIRLAEVEITRDAARRDTRTLTMFRVDMCSTGHGTTTGGTTEGGPVPPAPPL